MNRAPKVAAALAETTHKATLELGEGVVAGRLVWTSASGLTKIDTESNGGCPRKWWFEQVLGKRQPSTAAQAKGTKLHAEVEEYLHTGKPLITPIAVAGRHFVDEPGPGILIEHGLARATPEGIAAWLTVGSVCIAGHVDLWNHRGFYIDKEGDLRPEPRANTLETKDWKTSSDFQYCKTATELATNVQLVTYAEAGFRAWTHLEHARMTHVYFRTRGAPLSKLVTVLCDREQIGRRWEYVEGLVRLAADVARETDPDKVPGNRNACGAYGGCPHLTYCSVGSHDSLADIFGPRGAENVLARMRGEPVTQENTVSLIDKMNPAMVAAAQAGAPIPMTPQPVAPGVQTLPPAQGVGVSVSMAPAIDAEMVRLQNEETARRAQAAAGIPVGFAEALAVLDRSGYGSPTFVGRAASAVAAARGQTLAPGFGIQGSGWLAERVTQPVEDPALLLQLASEVAGLPPLPQAAPAVAPPPPVVQYQAPAPVAPIVQAPQQVAYTPPPPAPVVQYQQAPAPIAAPVQAPPAAPPQTISVLPPDAPASNPAIAANPVDGFHNAKTAELAAYSPGVPGLIATAASVAATGQLPGTAAASMLPATMIQAPPPAPTMIATPPAPTMIATPPPAQGETPATPPTDTAPTPAKRGPGRPRGPRKPKATPATTAAPGADQTQPAPAGEDDDTSINVYVNCVSSRQLERLEPYIERVCASLCAEYGASDVMCAPKDSPLGFGKWPGAIKALVRQHPPAPGDYLVKTNGNDPAAAVIDALRSLVEASGGEMNEGVTW